MRRTRRRTVAVVAVLAVLLTTMAFTGQPVRAIKCGFQARDGWTIEFPREKVTEAAFRKAVRDQTDCVAVSVRRVHTGGVPEGQVIRPRGARALVARGGHVEAWVEAATGPGVSECGEPVGEPSESGVTEVLTCPGVRPAAAKSR